MWVHSASLADDDEALKSSCLVRMVLPIDQVPSLDSRA